MNSPNCFIDGCKNKIVAEQVVHFEEKVNPFCEYKSKCVYYACEEHRMKNRPDLIDTHLS